MPFERNPDKIHIPAQVRIMWPGGPSRRWSPVSGCSEARMPYGEKGEFCGQYVCQGCGEATSGVYMVPQAPKQDRQGPAPWLCAECRTLAKPQKRHNRPSAGMRKGENK
jgi:hypothetical protein